MPAWKKWAIGILVALFIINAPETTANAIHGLIHAITVMFGQMNLH